MERLNISQHISDLLSPLRSLRSVGMRMMEELAETNQRTNASPCLGDIQFGTVVAEQGVQDGSQTVSVSQHLAPDLLLRVLAEVQWKEILGFPIELGKQLEHFNPPDLQDLGGKIFNSPGLQGNSHVATHPSLVSPGWAATSPAEVCPTGTGHVVTAVSFLPGGSTARAGSHLHHILHQLGGLGGLGHEGVEGEEVLTGGGAVVLLTTETAVGVATLAGDDGLTGDCPPGQVTTV